MISAVTIYLIILIQFEASVKLDILRNSNQTIEMENVNVDPSI